MKIDTWFVKEQTKPPDVHGLAVPKNASSDVSGLSNVIATVQDVVADGTTRFKEPAWPPYHVDPKVMMESHVATS